MSFLSSRRTLSIGFLLATSLAAAELPNIVFFLADDLGYRELGCYGQEKIKTPNIDRLAAEGMRFMQHYSGQTVCAPSRCALLTGKHMGHAQIRNNRGNAGQGQMPLADKTLTIAKILRGKGYATACVGKWGLGNNANSGSPAKQGFDLFFGYHCQLKAHHFYPEYLWRNEEKVLYPDNENIDGDDGNREPALRVRFAREARREIERRKRLLGVRDYNDLLGLLHSVLSDPVHGGAACARVRDRFRVVLIDEFQDTDPMQWDILWRAFHGSTTLILVGELLPDALR